MAIIFNSGANPEKIKYGSTNLTKVYYNGTLVWSQRVIYEGSQAKSIFKYAGVLIGSTIYDHMTGSHAKITASDSIQFDVRKNEYNRGMTRCITKEKVNISLYSHATVTFQTWAESGNTDSIWCKFGTQSTDGDTYSTSQISATSNTYQGTSTATTRTLTLSLQSTKSTTTEPYFCFDVQTSAYNSRTQYNTKWAYVKLLSIKLS